MLNPLRELSSRTSFHKLAALNGNIEVTSRLSQGNPYDLNVEGQLGRNRQDFAEAVLMRWAQGQS